MGISVQDVQVLVGCRVFCAQTATSAFCILMQWLNHWTLFGIPGFNSYCHPCELQVWEGCIVKLAAMLQKRPTLYVGVSNYTYPGLYYVKTSFFLVVVPVFRSLKWRRFNSARNYWVGVRPPGGLVVWHPTRPALLRARIPATSSTGAGIRKVKVVQAFY